MNSPEEHLLPTHRLRGNKIKVGAASPVLNPDQAVRNKNSKNPLPHFLHIPEQHKSKRHQRGAITVTTSDTNTLMELNTGD